MKNPTGKPGLVFECPCARKAFKYFRDSTWAVYFGPWLKAQPKMGGGIIFQIGENGPFDV